MRFWRGKNEKTEPMSSNEWGIVIGMVASALLALGPWMFMVHAKLAVLATMVDVLCKKVDRINEAFGMHKKEHDKLIAKISDHETRIVVIEEKVT